jgi:hypothetical protein
MYAYHEQYGHPGSHDDAAMAKNGSAFVKLNMGW